jgi:molecular chaperone GrpE
MSDQKQDSESKEIEELKEKIKQLENQSEEYLNGWKRAKADYINREKEISREKINWIEFANLELVLQFLPILDSFEGFLKQIPKDQEQNQWIKGVIQIKQQTENFLKVQGLEKIATIGEKFNPDYHEVVEKKGEEGKIIEEIHPGFLMHNKVIRTAKVVIG